MAATGGCTTEVSAGLSAPTRDILDEEDVPVEHGDTKNMCAPTANETWRYCRVGECVCVCWRTLFCRKMCRALGWLI